MEINECNTVKSKNSKSGIYKLFISYIKKEIILKNL